MTCIINAYITISITSMTLFLFKEETSNFKCTWSPIRYVYSLSNYHYYVQ